MAIARFKDLCLDADDAGRLGVFWAVLADLEGNEFCAFTQ